VAAVARRYRFLRQERVDLVHLNNSPCIGFSDWLPAARLANIPITCHSRGAYFGPASSAGRWLTRRFDAYVAISRYIQADLIENGAPQARIRQIYDGVALENWKLPPREEVARLRAEQGVPEDALLVVLVGLIRAWKGQAVALDALARLPLSERQKVRLWIVGGVSESERKYCEALHQRVADDGLSDTVAFLGHRSDVSRLMAAADVVLHASTIPEPFGLVVLEGLALGKMVIASQLGGPGEVLSPGDGMLFDPSHPEQLAAILSALIKDPMAKARYEERAFHRAQMFDVQQTVDSIGRVWADALGRRTSD
jgi:glycosyltransferase involved in cell wall biosynthesis